MTTQVMVWPRGLRRRYAAGPLGETRSGGDSRRVGKTVFMSQVGELQSVNVSTRYEDGFGGTDLLSWSIQPNGGFVGGMFRPGDHCRVTQGGGIVGEGEISEVLPQADGSVEFHARGYAYNLSEYNSVRHDESFVVSISGGTTAPAAIEYPTTRLVEAVGVGPGVTRSGWEYAVYDLGMPINAVIGSQTDWDLALGGKQVATGTPYLNEIVTERERRNGNRWAVWGRSLTLAPDPTTPMWQIDSPEGLVGVADTDYCTHVGVVYRWWDPIAWDNTTAWLKGNLVSRGLNGSTKWYTALVDVTGGTGPGLDTASWEETPFFIYDWMTSTEWAVDTDDNLMRFESRTREVDYRGGESMSGPGAQQVADSLLAQVSGRFILNGSFSVGPDGELKAYGGGRAPIAFVRAGQGLKLNHLRTTQANLMPDFVIIGKTEWQWQADDTESLTITPMGAVPRDLGSILAGIPYNAPSDTAVA